jgi:hypothetical protein
MIKWNDRTIGIVGLVVGGVGLVVGAVGLWFAYLASPWGTRNDQFCYRLRFVELNEYSILLPTQPFAERVERECYYTRAECEQERGKREEEAKAPDALELLRTGQREAPKPISECHRGD